MDKTQHTITKFGITLTVSLSSDIVDGENFGPKVEWVSSSIDELIEDISSHPPSDSSTFRLMSNGRGNSYAGFNN